LQSLLTQDYFDNILLSGSNKYINYNTYDTTQPLITQKYSNIDTFDKTNEVNENENDDTKCSIVIKDHISNKELKGMFPANTKEHVYSSTPVSCSFNAILKIIQNHDVAQKDITINMLKEILLEEYQKLYGKYKVQLLQVWRAQGKKILAGQIIKKQITLSDMIISEDYYATNIDVWILAIHYKIPLIFIT